MELFLSLSLFLICVFGTGKEATAQKFSKNLDHYIKTIVNGTDQIPAKRKVVLEQISAYVYQALKADKKANLLAICTHNSRRSQITQTWIATAALYYGIEGVQAFSGGTEATAFNKNAIAGLERAGFLVQKGPETNPQVHVSVGAQQPKWRMFSKKFTHEINPPSGFAGIMVCSDADKACPLVPGAAARFSLPFKDPRHFDNTSVQDAKYDETVKQIAQEMFLMMKYVRDKMALDKK
ncbi:MAG TPA: protein-tyrosine-phosphatase [Microscillaceae bacterium]|nr:protein-tyrosine-phosphatase [Microscillaceae bacterium]